MVLHRTRPGAESYGHAAGILLLDERAPFIPGDLRNAATFRYPVLYRTVPGLTAAACASGDPAVAAKVIDAARWLEAHGVRLIAGDCAAMLAFQDAVRAAVRVPVALSSLLQLPSIARGLEQSRAILIVAAERSHLAPELLARDDLRVANPLILRGMQEGAEFRAAVLERKGTLDSERVSDEIVRLAEAALAAHPEIGAVLLESARLPPYARAVQRATGLPVYDFVSMIDFLRTATHRERYVGHY